MSRLREAILARQSLLLHGPPESGKTALFNETLSSQPEAVHRNCILCHSCENPRRMWWHLMHCLGEAGEPQVLSRVKRECHSPASLACWLDKQSSVRLRGILRSAMRAGDYCVLIDAPGILPARAYRLLQEWVWSGRTPVFLAARGISEHELGRVARLFWHEGMRLELGPLQPEDTQALLENSIARFGLTQLADAEYRDFVLAQCEGLPGRIVRLCELASQRTYQSCGHIKLHTLAVDFLMRSEAMLPTVLQADHHD